MLLTSFYRPSCNVRLIGMDQRAAFVTTNYTGETPLEFQKLSYLEHIAGNPREYRILFKKSRSKHEIPNQGSSSKPLAPSLLVLTKYFTILGAYFHFQKSSSLQGWLHLFYTNITQLCVHNFLQLSTSTFY